MKLNYYLPLVLSLSVLVSAVSFSYAEEYSVFQKDQQFSESNMEIKVGDVVRFENSDEIFHNVFSLSDAKTFDLGSYPKGQFKSVEFNQAGEIEVECAIHPDMFMTIQVVE